MSVQNRTKFSNENLNIEVEYRVVRDGDRDGGMERDGGWKIEIEG